jgi:hypothetical protein
VRPLVLLAAVAITCAGCKEDPVPTDIRQPGAVAWVLAHTDSARVFGVTGRVDEQHEEATVAGYVVVATGPKLNKSHVALLQRLYVRPCQMRYQPTPCVCSADFAVRVYSTALIADLLYCSECRESHVGGTGTIQRPKGLPGFSPCVLDSLESFLRALVPAGSG